jgi:hypothetical protein
MTEEGANIHPPLIQQLADALGGTVEHVVGPLPDGSGFATMSLPLPVDHWSTRRTEEYEPPPMPFRLGIDHPEHSEWVLRISAAARYAYRASTMAGQDLDLDPDALVMNFVIGMLGYFSSDGTADEAWSNPDPLPPRHMTASDVRATLDPTGEALP